MAAKFTNSSDESSMGSVVYFSSRVFTENLGEREGEGAMWCQVRRRGMGVKGRIRRDHQEHGCGREAEGKRVGDK